MKKILLIFYFLPIISNSQIINFETLRINEKKNFNGFIEMNYEFKKVEETDWELDNKILLNWKYNSWSIYFVNEINLDRAAGINFSNDGYQHIRINKTLNNKIKFESFFQNQYDPIRKIENRKIIGGGLRFSLLNYHIGLSSFYEKEKLNYGLIEKNIRLSSYLNFSFLFNKIIEINSTFYYQPKFSVIENYRISNNTDLLIKINNNLFLTNSIKISYDSFPATQIPKTIINLENGLSFKF
tara:strand:+ start:4405 stop:5127 length:723 start_codon:yes stop_codon:yes gene_type:complete